MNADARKVVVVARLEPEVVDRLRKSARENDRSLSGELRHVTRKYLEAERLEASGS